MMMKWAVSLWGSQQSNIQTCLLSYRDKLENCNFACSKFRYDTFHLANNTGADQTEHMRRLVCAFVVHKPPKTGFLASRPKQCGTLSAAIIRSSGAS